MLRRLVECVAHAGVGAARHEKFARALGGAFEENGRFDFDKRLRVEIVPNGLRGLVAHAQKIEIARAAEVEITVLQTEVFVDFIGAFVFKGEGQNFADIVYYHVGGDDLYLACF